MTDLYTKAVLTVIAAALCIIAVKGSAIVDQAIADPAVAQASACGGRPVSPCYVEVVNTVDVKGAVDISNSVRVKGTVNIGNSVRIDTGPFGLRVHMR